jgi:hypothetical protein
MTTAYEELVAKKAVRRASEAIGPLRRPRKPYRNRVVGETLGEFQRRRQIKLATPFAR